MEKSALKQLTKEANILINKLTGIVDRLEQEDINKPKLTFYESEGELLFKFDNNLLGFISKKGICHFLSSPQMIITYNLWCEAGFPVDTETTVKWKDSEYKISKHGILYNSTISMITFGDIYNFKTATAIEKCEDMEIERLEFNGKPILF